MEHISSNSLHARMAEVDLPTTGEREGVTDNEPGFGVVGEAMSDDEIVQQHSNGWGSGNENGITYDTKNVEIPNYMRKTISASAPENVHLSEVHRLISSFSSGSCYDLKRLPVEMKPGAIKNERKLNAMRNILGETIIPRTPRTFILVLIIFYIPIKQPFTIL
jgi:hypothetical protein